MKYIDLDYIKSIMPVCKKDQHKGDCGKVLICGGKIGLSGAVCLSAMSALRSGSGLVTVGIPRSLNSIYEIKLTEAMSLPLDDYEGIFTDRSYIQALDFAKSCDSVAVGVGGGLEIKNLTKKFIENYTNTLIIDADGLNSICEIKDCLKNTKAKIIITPHIGEMSRLTGLDINYIKNNKITVAEDFAKEYNIVVVLKGENTVITNGTETYINTTGNEGMATGGAGDVLTGIILSLSGRGMSCLDSACLGVYIHGLAGDIAKSELNEFSMIAGDIINSIYKAINIIKGEE